MSEEVKLTVLDGLEDGVTPVKDEVIDVNFLEQFVGDGKKYATAEELAKGYGNADEFIETLKNEKKEVERQLVLATQDKKTVEEIMEEIKKAAVPPTADPKQDNPVSFTAEDVSKMITDKFTAEKEQTAAEKQETAAMELRKEIQAKLMESLEGAENLTTAIKSYANGDKTKLALLDQMVVVDYDNAVKMLKEAAGDKISFDSGVERKRTAPAPVPSGLTWSKCQAIKTADPKLYRSVEFQNKMHEMAAMNPKFMST